jgi:hypothetical protein
MWGYLPEPVAMSPQGTPTRPAPEAGEADLVAAGLVGAPEAARMLGVSAQWVRRQAADGHLGARQVSGRWLLDANAVRDEAARRRNALERRLGSQAPPLVPAASVPSPGSWGSPPAVEAGVSGTPGGAVGEWERESWALERQLLLAQADAAERRAQLSRLEATIGQRDATIAALQAELGRVRSERDRWQQAASGLLDTFATQRE